MGRFVCKKCGSTLTFKRFPFWNSGWFCPVCGKIKMESSEEEQKLSLEEIGSAITNK